MTKHRLEKAIAPEPIVIDAHGKHAQAVHFTKNGRFLVSVGQDARVRLWSTPGFAAAGVFEGHKNSVNTISFSADETLLATGSTDATVRVWSFPDGRALRVLDKQLSPVFAPNADQVATISAKGEVVLWDARTGERVVAIPAPDKRTFSLAFGPDGRRLLIGGAGAIYCYAIPGAAKEGEMKGHAVAVACLRVSPDGKLLASTGGDGHLRLWSTKDWSEARRVKLEGAGVFQIAFSPKGDAVAVSTDRLIQSYSVKDGSVVERIEVPLKGVYGVAFSPDGRYLANAAADGKVRVWERRPK
jgi:WD40 repeat protein